MSALEYSHVDGVATITLNNPPQNRMSGELSQGLMAAVQDLADRNDTRVLLLKANGPDFSYGGDITAWMGLTEEEFSQNIGGGVMLTNMFQDFPFPIVVAVQGYCGGGGFEMTLRGDIIIGAENATFGHSEATIGVFTFLGGVQRVAERVGRTLATKWAITAERVDAQTALDTGLITEVVPVEDLEAVAQRWVDKLKGDATLAHAAHKKLLRAWSNGGIAEADAMMGQMAGEILHSEDAQGCLPAASEAVKTGAPRPEFDFKGR
ncbi:MAG: enoyl-CoA hydratase/isomerase family protein [Pseudomonadota bacterium]